MTFSPLGRKWLRLWPWAIFSFACIAAGSALAQTRATVTAHPGATAHVFGRRERVVIAGQAGFEFVARLDGKADFSSLTPISFKYFTRDSQVWVRFTLDNGAVLQAQQIVVERQVVRDERIRLPNGAISHRPWVSIDFCIGNQLLTSMIAVSDRQAYLPPLQFGREDAEKLGPINPNAEFTIEPKCPVPAPVAQ